jgi:hypothetical protein
MRASCTQSIRKIPTSRCKTVFECSGLLSGFVFFWVSAVSWKLFSSFLLCMYLRVWGFFFFSFSVCSNWCSFSRRRIAGDMWFVACEVGFEVAGILCMKESFWLYARVFCFCSLCHARSLCSCRVVLALSGKNVNPTLFCDRFRVLATRVVVVVVLRICGSILWAGTSRDLFRFTFA